jgi:hypothetical protein
MLDTAGTAITFGPCGACGMPSASGTSSVPAARRSSAVRSSSRASRASFFLGGCVMSSDTIGDTGSSWAHKRAKLADFAGVSQTRADAHAAARPAPLPGTGNGGHDGRPVQPVRRPESLQRRT